MRDLLPNESATLTEGLCPVCKKEVEIDSRIDRMWNCNYCDSSFVLLNSEETYGEWCCANCNYEYSSIYPEGLKESECPKCRTMGGRLCLEL